MSKSIPFRSVFTIPKNVEEGMILDFKDGKKSKVTRIKSIKFLSGSNLIEVIGFSKPINE